MIGFLLFALAQRSQLDDVYKQRAVSIARVAADDPQIRAAMATGTPPAKDSVVQTRAQNIAASSGASYVIVVDLHGVRHSHPHPALVGERISDPVVARDGRPHTRINVGATGRSANGIVPLYGPDHRLLGEVSAGIAASQVTSALRQDLATFGAYVGIALGIGVAASFLLAARLKRSTFGLELEEIAGLLQDREAMLHGIREGVLGFDAQSRITVVNGEARRLLGLPDEVEGRLVTELGLDPAVARKLAPGHVITDEVLTVGDRLLVVNSLPTDSAGGPPGGVTTLRDSTELRLLSQRAEAARRRLKLLYDTGGAVGTTLDPSRTADELARVGVPRFADFTVVDLVEGVLQGEEPVADAVVRLRRVAVHGVRDDHPFGPAGEVHEFVPGAPEA